MVFGLGRRNREPTIKIKAKGRGAPPPLEFLTPNTFAQSAMAPMPMQTMQTMTTIAPPMPAVAPPMAARYLGGPPPAVTTETYAVQYPTETRMMPVAPPPVIEEQIVHTQFAPVAEQPIEVSIERVPQLPTGYEGVDEFFNSGKAQEFYATDKDADTDDTASDSSYTSFEEEVYCYVPNGAAAPRGFPGSTYTHGYQTKGRQPIVDQYYENGSSTRRVSPSMARRSQLLSYTDMPASSRYYAPSPSYSRPRRSRAVDRFDDRPQLPSFRSLY